MGATTQVRKYANTHSFSHSGRIYVPLGYGRKERVRGRTKLSEGQIFTFRDHQHVVCQAQKGYTWLIIKKRKKLLQGSDDWE